MNRGELDQFKRVLRAFAALLLIIGMAILFCLYGKSTIICGSYFLSIIKGIG